MPGKHVPPGPGDLIEKVNEIVKAVPPTNGWMIEFMGERAEGAGVGEGEGNGVGYRIYVSGDTLFVDELKDIPKRYPHVDLMLIHLGTSRRICEDDIFSVIYDMCPYGWVLRRNDDPGAFNAAAYGDYGRGAGHPTRPSYSAGRYDSNPL